VGDKDGDKLRERLDRIRQVAARDVTQASAAPSSDPIPTAVEKKLEDSRGSSMDVDPAGSVFPSHLTRRPSPISMTNTHLLAQSMPQSVRNTSTSPAPREQADVSAETIGKVAYTLTRIIPDVPPEASTHINGHEERPPSASSTTSTRSLRFTTPILHSRPPSRTSPPPLSPQAPEEGEIETIPSRRRSITPTHVTATKWPQTSLWTAAPPTQPRSFNNPSLSPGPSPSQRQPPPHLDRPTKPVPSAPRALREQQALASGSNNSSSSTRSFGGKGYAPRWPSADRNGDFGRVRERERDFDAGGVPDNDRWSVEPLRRPSIPMIRRGFNASAGSGSSGR